MVTDPSVTAALSVVGRFCSRCLHAWHGRRICLDANCCSCRLTWREALFGTS